MGSFARRHFWIVHLLLLTAIAWLGARVINNLLAAHIVALPTRPTTAPPAAPRSTARLDPATVAEAIADRNLFNATPPAMDLSHCRSASPKPTKRDGVTPLGENRFRIDRAMIREHLGAPHLPTFARQMRLIPIYRDGKSMGFKIAGLRPDSLYAHIGLCSGDILRTIDGQRIGNPNTALTLYDKLANADHVVLGLQRRGRPVRIELTIQ